MLQVYYAQGLFARASNLMFSEITHSSLDIFMVYLSYSSFALRTRTISSSVLLVTKRARREGGASMSGNVVAGYFESSVPLPEVFRFSPRSNQAHKIRWYPWSEVAFEEAVRLDKPIFLLISSPWRQ